jgi:hypothetical protein
MIEAPGTAELIAKSHELIARTEHKLKRLRRSIEHSKSIIAESRQVLAGFDALLLRTSPARGLEGNSDRGPTPSR